MSRHPSFDSAPGALPDSRTLIDQLLEEQRQLTAVEAFSRIHDVASGMMPNYRALLPATAPAPGQQYAFEVLLDQCSGCKACVAACHSLNGLDDGEAWREVGQLISDDWRRPVQQTVTTACHHCVDPGCLNGCPVMAYDKDPTTGIVRHLDDQCIGCQYCVMKCPYEVPKYSEARGIVRKCDMCSQRLAVGEAPACVQACPNEAIRITLIDPRAVHAEFRWESPQCEASTATGPVTGGKELPRAWLPGAPDPSITLPTTRFRSRQPLAPDLVPADLSQRPLQPAHWPLVWMLILTQMSVGAFGVCLFAPRVVQAGGLWAALAAGGAGLAASVLHLGKPLKAWRSFLGLRRSWLSREIVVFGLFAPLAALTAVLHGKANGRFGLALIAATTVIGLLGIGCSAMVYHDTHRVFWRLTRSAPRFLLTALVLGLALGWLLSAFSQATPAWLPPVLALATGLKLTLELRVVRLGETPLAEDSWPRETGFDAWSLARTGRWLRQELGLVTRWRLLCGVAGGVLAPLAAWLPGVEVVALATAGALLCGAGELAERYTFFRAVVPPRMPGGV